MELISSEKHKQGIVLQSMCINSDKFYRFANVGEPFMEFDLNNPLHRYKSITFEELNPNE